MRRSCCVPACCSRTQKLFFCGSCERPLHEGCTSPLHWPLNLYCIFCPNCQEEPWLQGAFIQVGGQAGKAGSSSAQIKSAVEHLIKHYVASRKAAGRTTTYSGLRSAGRELYQQWEKMTDEHPDLNIGFRFERVPNSGSARRSQVRWRLAMDWGDPPSTQGHQDAQALLQLADAAAEVEATSAEAATTAASVSAVQQAAADAFTEAGSTARAAASGRTEDAETTGAVANAEAVSTAIAANQPNIRSSFSSVPDVHATRAASKVQATAANISSIQTPSGAQDAHCAVPVNLHSPAATLLHSNEQPASENAGKPVTAPKSKGVKQVELSKAKTQPAKQYQNAAKHSYSLSAAALPAPKAVRDQTIPSMFRKKRKAQLLELTQQLQPAKKPCVEVIDLLNDHEPITPAASDTPSRGEFGCGRDEPEIIVIDDPEDRAVAVPTNPPVGQVEAMAPLPDPQQPVDKEALVLEMLKSLGPCDSRLSVCFKDELQKCKGCFAGRSAYSNLISRMYTGLQETLEDIEQLPFSEQENDVANYFRVFFGLQPKLGMDT